MLHMQIMLVMSPCLPLVLRLNAKSVKTLRHRGCVSACMTRVKRMRCPGAAGGCSRKRWQRRQVSGLAHGSLCQLKLAHPPQQAAWRPAAEQLDMQSLARRQKQVATHEVYGGCCAQAPVSKCMSSTEQNNNFPAAMHSTNRRRLHWPLRGCPGPTSATGGRCAASSSSTLTQASTYVPQPACMPLTTV